MLSALCFVLLQSISFIASCFSCLFVGVCVCVQAAEVACIIQQKRDMCYRSSSLVETVYQVKDHLGVGRKFWAALKGDRGDCQGYLFCLFYSHLIIF